MILLPKAPIIISKKDNLAVFEIENLYPGYGVTIGNSLRRVLLSSLEGAAVTHVNMKGVSHEFSTIDGVMEDAITIIMNLKKLRFKIYGDEPQKATLKVKGDKEVTGADFDLPTQLELINKDAHIATISDKKKEFEMEIQVEKGIGYAPVEQRKPANGEKPEIGVIQIDSIFTPAKRVNFRVENMRVGERTDFDRLTLEVETDGTIAPEDAFFKACEILVGHFSLLEETFKREDVSEESKKEEESGDKEKAKKEAKSAKKASAKKKAKK